MTALAEARRELVSASVALFVAARTEGRTGPRMKAAAEAVEEALFALDREMEEAQPEAQVQAV